jgi:undecaprenyl-diphosphatase
MQQHFPNLKSLRVANILSLLVFLTLLYLVINKGAWLLHLDTWVNSHAAELQTPALTKIIIFITNLDGVTGSGIISIIILLFLASKKWYRDIRFYLISFGGSSLLFTVIKEIVGRARPSTKIIEELGYSFPSGHATMSMTLSLIIYFIFINKIPSETGRRVLLVFCVVWPILISFTRLYLNVHWFSDVLGGMALGIFWVTLVVLLFQKKAHAKS